MLQKAIQLATNAHRNQKDKGGRPYIFHPIRVSLKMKSDTSKIIALLHDVVEDTPWTISDLRNHGFNDVILKSVDILTRKKNQYYDEYLESISSDPFSREVKIADLEDNMDITRLPFIQVKDLDRLKKYHNAYRYLKGQ